LRFYAVVEIYAMLAVILALFLKPRYTRGRDLAVLAGFYLLAKITETFDSQIFSLGHLLSGHTIKHILARWGVIGYCGCWCQENQYLNSPPEDYAR